MRRTDGFVARLVLEVLADGQEYERYKLHEMIGKLAKGKYGKRSQPQYRLVEDSLTALRVNGLIEHRYAPSHYDREDVGAGSARFGKDYYKATPVNGAAISEMWIDEVTE